MQYLTRDKLHDKRVFESRGVSGRARDNHLEIVEALPAFIDSGGEIKKINPPSGPDVPTNPFYIHGLGML